MCGFIAIIGDDLATPSLMLGLQALQHRGQDAAGIATIDENRFHIHKDLGMVTQALPVAALDALHGNAGIGHVRYPTAGLQSTAEDAQPFLTRQPGIVLAHNGNVTNVPELTEQLRNEGVCVLSSCDAEPILLVFATALSRIRPTGHTKEDVVLAIKEVYQRVRGGYSVVALLEVDGRPTLVAFRDPHGIRPGVYGQRSDGAWIAASESVSLDVLGTEKLGDLPVGSALLLRAGEDAIHLSVTPPKPRHCVFERIYFARPDSRMEDGRVNHTRWQLGTQLAAEWKGKGHEIDVVVAVPDTSRPAAQALAETLGVRHREGFIKNRYSGRTFIMPDQKTRKAALRLKLNPIREVFEGQRVLLIDDSIVRGNTMRRIVAMVRELNPAAIHVGIFAPPVRHPCFYGIDMPSQDELIAATWSQDQADEACAQYLGVDSVTFLSQSGLEGVFEPSTPICSACFNGDYVVAVSDAERAAICSERRG